MFKAVKNASAILAFASISSAVLARPSVQFFPQAGSTKPFSPAVRVGNVVYISGVVGTGADGSLPADFTAQARNTMENVAARLKLAGASLDDVYKCSVAMTDMNNWAAFNEVYVKYFKPGRFPVRMAMGVDSLRGPAVEVQCEAFLRK